MQIWIEHAVDGSKTLNIDFDDDIVKTMIEQDPFLIISKIAENKLFHTLFGN